MAFSMMSSTNYKRKCVSSSSRFIENNDHHTYCFGENDWIGLDLEDFMSHNNRSYSYENNEDSSLFSYSSTSFKIASDFVVHDNYEKMSSKKTKTMETFVDLELEDTASSPIQSPKINDNINLFYMKSEEIDSGGVSKEKRNTASTTQAAGDCTNMSLLLESELRKKGLCLIPTSIILNYLTANVI